MRGGGADGTTVPTRHSSCGCKFLASSSWPTTRTIDFFATCAASARLFTVLTLLSILSSILFTRDSNLLHKFKNLWAKTACIDTDFNARSTADSAFSVGALFNAAAVVLSVVLMRFFFCTCTVCSFLCSVLCMEGHDTARRFLLTPTFMACTGVALAAAATLCLLLRIVGLPPN